MPRTKLDKPDSSKKLVALLAGAAKAERKTCIDMTDMLGVALTQFPIDYGSRIISHTERSRNWAEVCISL